MAAEAPASPQIQAESWRLFGEITDRYPQHPAGGAIALGQFWLMEIQQGRLTVTQVARMRLGDNAGAVLRATITSHRDAGVNAPGVAQFLEFAGALPRNVFLQTLATVFGHISDEKIANVPANGEVVAAIERGLASTDGPEVALGVFATLAATLGTAEDERRGVYTETAKIAGKNGEFGAAIRAARTQEEKTAAREVASGKLTMVFAVALREAPHLDLRASTIGSIAAAVTVFEPAQSIIDTFLPKPAA